MKEKNIYAIIIVKSTKENDNLKRKLIAASSFLLAFSLAGCDSRKNDTEKTDSTDISTPAVTEKYAEEDDIIPASPVIASTEDFFGKLDESSKKQISLIALKLPELTGEHQYIYLTDLDGNGRSELILCEPDFVIYEVSENMDSLVQTAVRSSDIPVLYPVTDRLMFVDEGGKRHYIWRSIADESDSSVRESEKEYIYENGQLSERMLRSRVYDKYTGSYSSFSNAEGSADIQGYSNALSALCFNSGNRLQQSAMGVLNTEDIKNADSESLKQMLAELKGYFSVREPSGKYQYTDLNGTWIRKGGFSSGSSYFQESGDSTLKIVFHDNMYEISGNDSLVPPSGASPVSFNLGGNINTSLWYASLTDNGILKNVTVTINSDATLIFEGQITDRNGQTVNAEWTFYKEGWEYPSAQPVIQAIEASAAESEAENPVSPETPNTPVFSPEMIGEKALSYYENKNSYRPGKVEVFQTETEDIYSVHLYDEYNDYTWYTISSATMTGTDNITGETVDLNF